MLSEKLLEIINSTSHPSQLLKKLKELNFAPGDLTDEGDTILHLLAKSKHVRSSIFSTFVSALKAAGARVNALDKQGKTFLGYYARDPRLVTPSETFNLMLNDVDFDVNQNPEPNHSFFEIIYHLDFYGASLSLKRLIDHKEFKPNLKTSKHNSILLHVISEPLNADREDRDLVYSLLTNDKTDLNIRNNQGQTALGQVLAADTEFKDIKLIKTLVNHPRCDIDALDPEGNNYLQLVINTTTSQAGEDIAVLLLNGGINVSHKNNEGKMVLDLIRENKIKRLEYYSTRLLLQILKLRPFLLLEKDSNGNIILSTLLRSRDYAITSEWRTFLQLCKEQKNGSEILKNIISAFFTDFHRNQVDLYLLVLLIKAIVDVKVDIDVEYCLAIIAIRPRPFSEKNDLYNKLKNLKSQVSLKVIESHIIALTQEHAEERAQGMAYAKESALTLNCFDNEMLALEEQYLYKQTNADLESDSKMFGHLFSLDGSIPLNNKLVPLTSSSYIYTAPFIAHLMNAYVTHCEQSGKYKEHLEAITQVRNMTIKGMRYYFLFKKWNDYYPSIKAQGTIEASVIEDSRTTGVEVLTGWSGHAVDLIVKMKDLYRNNGGGCSTDAPTEQYEMSHADHLTPFVVGMLYPEVFFEANKSFIQRDLHHILGLKYIVSIPGSFQTVGNCSLFSQLIALKIKNRLFLPLDRADEIYVDMINFFEQFYLGEYLKRYAANPVLPHLLMRLIIQRLMPNDKLELVAKLLKDHFKSEMSQEIMHIEFMLASWRLRVNGKSVAELESQLKSLGIDLSSKMNRRLELLARFLNDQVTPLDLDEVKTWSVEQQTFQGYHLLHFAVVSNNLALAASLIQMFPEAVNHSNWFTNKPLALVRSVAMIDLLVKAGAPLTNTECDNELDCAIKADRVDLVEALLKSGALSSEYSAYYAGNKNPKILKLLMELRPEAMTKTTHNYSTAAHVAARCGHTENLHNLVYYGNNHPDAPDVNGVTPIHLALKSGKKDTAKKLIEYPGTLFKAPYRGDSVVDMTADDELKKMIELKKKEREAAFEYFTQFKEGKFGIVNEEVDHLIVAIRKNDLVAVRGCLLHFPKINVLHNSKNYSISPLADAINGLIGREGKEYENALEIVKLLVKTPGIDINTVLPTSEPILFLALANLEVLELFLADEKLQPNKQDNLGYTALHNAVQRGLIDAVKRLLEDQRVDSTLTTKDGQTVMDLQGYSSNQNRKIKECQEEVAHYQSRTRSVAMI